MTTPGKAAKKALDGRTRLINATVAEVRRLLEEANRQIRATLAAAPSDYQQWFLTQLQAEIRRALETLGNDAAAAVDAGQLKAWREGAALVDAVTAAAAVRAVMPTIDVGQLTAMRAFLTEKVKGITLEAMNAINSQLGLVAIGAQTPFDAVKAISTLLNEDTRRRATTIVHTELARAYSTANQARMEQFARLVPGMKKRWVSSGKLHPRIEHQVIHGQEQPVDQPFLLEGGAVKMMYPHDPSAPARHTINCGCVAVPVVPKDNPYQFKRTVGDVEEEQAAIERLRAQRRTKQ